MLNIKNQDVCRLVKDLADRTGESMTAAVHMAVKERLERLDAPDKKNRFERIMALSAETARLWDHSMPDHGDLLYDDQGLPK